MDGSKVIFLKHYEGANSVNCTLRLNETFTIDGLNVSGDLKGTGIGTRLLYNILKLAFRLGAEEVKLEAYNGVRTPHGCFFFARYMLPAKEDWQILRADLLDVVAANTDLISTEDKAVLKKLLRSPDPKKLWQLADMKTPVQSDDAVPLGYFLMSEIDIWKGSFNFNDAAQVKHFKQRAAAKLFKTRDDRPSTNASGKDIDFSLKY